MENFLDICSFKQVETDKDGQKPNIFLSVKFLSSCMYVKAYI